MTSATPPPFIEQVRGKAGIVGAAGLALTIVGGFFDATQFFRSYLFAFLFWNGAALGCLCLLLIQHLTGGRWGAVMSRLLEAGGRTLAYLGVAFIPLLFGLGRLYPWAHAEAAHDGALRHKALYLNPTFFTARALFYFVVWSALAYFMTRWSLRLDKGRDLRLERRMRSLSGGGLVLLGLTITFSSIDWGMSLTPHWSSTIYGILFMVAGVLEAFTLVILLLTAIRNDAPMRAVLTDEIRHDLGKLLFAFIMLWSYVHLSQFLIVWSANIPEEIPWYLLRTSGGWAVLGLAVVVLHFAIPFATLLSRETKRDPLRLARVAGLVLFARFLDLFWVLAPAHEAPPVAFVHWMDVTAVAGLGGLWIFAFTRELARGPLLPQSSPELVDAHAS
jgi:hypothetical protein